MKEKILKAFFVALSIKIIQKLYYNIQIFYISLVLLINRLVRHLLYVHYFANNSQ